MFTNIVKALTLKFYFLVIAWINPVELVDFTNGERLPQEVIEALSDETVIKHAFNANFERVCLSRFLGIDGFLNPRGWHCTMIWVATLGLPLSLAGVGAALGLDK